MYCVKDNFFLLRMSLVKVNYGIYMWLDLEEIFWTQIPVLSDVLCETVEQFIKYSGTLDANDLKGILKRRGRK